MYNFTDSITVSVFMDIVKFVKSFNTVGTYLALSATMLVFLVVYFYVINPL